MSSSQDSMSDVLKHFDDSSHLSSSKALEMIMRDVMGGMENFATLASFAPNPSNGYEILLDEESPAEQAIARRSKPSQSGEVVLIHRHKKDSST